jgi:SAM-dependent methyltransferase
MLSAAAITPDPALLAACHGDAVSIGARARWGLVADARAMRYCDEVDLATLRARHPAWRAMPLAPVSIVCDAATLDAIPDASLDCLVAFRLLADPARAREGLQAARRVLRPGGTLLLPMPDARYLAGEPDDEVGRLQAGLDAIEAMLLPGHAGAEGWTTTRMLRLLASLPADWTGGLEIEAAGRIGAEAIVAMSNGAPGGHGTGALVQHGGRVYVIDGRLARHVQSPAVLEPLRRGGRAIAELPATGFRRLAIGAPMRAADVAEFLSRGRHA